MNPASGTNEAAPSFYDPGQFDGPSYNAGFDDGEAKGRHEAATERAIGAALDVEALDPKIIQHAWMILTGIHLPDSERWEPDRYNGHAFLVALMAEYRRLASETPRPGEAP